MTQCFGEDLRLALQCPTLKAYGVRGTEHLAQVWLAIHTLIPRAGLEVHEEHINFVLVASYTGLLESLGNDQLCWYSVVIIILGERRKPFDLYEMFRTHVFQFRVKLKKTDS